MWASHDLVWVARPQDLVASLSLWGAKFYPRQVSVGLVANKVAVELCSPSTSIVPCHYHSTTAPYSFIYHSSASRIRDTLREDVCIFISLNSSENEKCFTQSSREKSQNTFYIEQILFWKSCRLWDNLLRMRFAYWITKATDTLSEYSILIALWRQQWLRERVPVSRHRHCTLRVFLNQTPEHINAFFRRRHEFKISFSAHIWLLRPVCTPALQVQCRGQFLHSYCVPTDSNVLVQTAPSSPRTSVWQFCNSLQPFLTRCTSISSQLHTATNWPLISMDNFGRP
jgi:hypothetical protein